MTPPANRIKGRLTYWESNPSDWGKPEEWSFEINLPQSLSIVCDETRRTPKGIIKLAEKRADKLNIDLIVPPEPPK